MKRTVKAVIGFDLDLPDETTQEEAHLIAHELIEEGIPNVTYVETDTPDEEWT